MYYVYELIDPRVNLPFYVGKGKGNRVYFHLSEQSRAKSDNFKKFDKIKKIRKEGYEPEVKIVQYFEEENDAYDYEEELIKKYGKRDIDENGILTNICESSRPPKLKGRTYQQIYGDKWEEQIQKRLKTKEERRNYGGVRKHTEETKRKISEKVAGKNNPSYGVPCSEDRKRKISQKAKERYANGFTSPSAKTWKLLSPEGKEYVVTGELKKFCKLHNISYATMCAAIKYNRTGPRRNGWTIKNESQDT
jgi:hypothetical protein